MSNVNDLLNEAMKETKKLEKDEIFLVKDLFKGYLWNRIPRKDRILLGTLFLNQVNKMDGGGIKAIEKTSSNQQKYMKIRNSSFSIFLYPPSKPLYILQYPESLVLSPDTLKG